MLPTIATGNVASAIGSGYDVANSCRWNFGDSPAMNKSQTAGNTKTWTYSWWCKRGVISGSAENDWFKVYASGSNLFHVRFNTNDDLYCEINNGSAYGFTTNRKFRDPSAWYHFALIMDTTQGTDTNRMKLFVNGINELTVGGFSSITYPAENADLAINNSAATFYLGTTQSATEEFDGYMADVVLLDGTAAAIGDLGENDEDSPTIWKPKDPSGLTFGNNGFHLDFKDSANLGNDANGGTDFTETNLAAADQATDTPTNNFCTLNPLINSSVAAGTNKGTLSEGNLKLYNASAVGVPGTIFVNKGKWYFENKLGGETDAKYTLTGIVSESVVASSDLCDGTTAGGFADFGGDKLAYAYYGNDGKLLDNDSVDAYGATLAANDIVGVAVDLDNNNLYFAKNNAWQNSGDPTSGATGTGAKAITNTYYTAFISSFSGGSTNGQLNFGGGAVWAPSSAAADADGAGTTFEYAPPSGYFALCTKNLANYG